MTIEEHKANLAKCCRICGTLFTKVKKNPTQYECLGYDKKSGVPFSEMLQHAFTDALVEYDDEEIHPKTFCHKCLLVLGRWCKAQANQQKFRPAKRGYKWEPHSDDCKLCKRFAGRGRSQKGKVQAKKPQRSAYTENLQDTNNTSPTEHVQYCSSHD